MRYTNFSGGVFGKIVGALLCIILGMVLTLGGIALGGYLLVTKTKIGTIEDFAQEKKLPIDFAEEYREKSLLEWGQQLLPVLKEYSSTPIGTL